MGLVKSQWIESQARGWDAPDKHACTKCLEDTYLQSVVLENASETRCDYCKRTARKAIAAPLASILEPIAAALFAHYAEPGAAGLPRDSGEWVGEHHIRDTSDALESLPLECHGDLFTDITGSFHNTAWYPCAGGYWLDSHPHVELGNSWNRFVNEVKHHSRYFFGSQQDSDSDGAERSYSPLDLLREIGRMVESLGLIRVIPSGTRLFRVRKKAPETSLNSFAEMGPPPPERATAGRMNPAGISYFYLALEDTTALAEVLDKPPSHVALATFTSSTNLHALDVAQLPPIPSVFDASRSDARETLLFLRKFIKTIAEPMTKDGREHIDYVPSQIVSEFFSQIFQSEAGDRLDAAIYASAVMPEGQNVVIFPIRDYKRKLEDMVKLSSVDYLTIEDWREFARKLGLGCVGR